jgi:predicted CXXCH cytochrome family protein
MHRMFSIRLIAAAILAATLVLIGCQGERGPAGPQGPAGTGQTGEVRFMGDNATACGHCHSALARSWMGTGHAGAYGVLTGTSNPNVGPDSTNNYCLQCHTTGFDSKFSFPGARLSTGADTTGYDDKPIAALRGVQCESCHGAMGPLPAAHNPEMTNVFSAQVCYQCHSQAGELDSSAHGHELTTEDRGATCSPCHSSEGFIMTKDANWPAGSLTVANHITCVTCHDAHSVANPSQLRTVSTATGPFTMARADSGSYTISGLGKGQLCAQCHHARRDKANVTGQVLNGTNHPGPHESPQADMLTGNGAIELPGSITRGPLHPQLTDACVDCHMYQLTREQTGGPLMGHLFEPDIRKCQQCHEDATNFDIGNVQTETMQLLDSLALYLPHNADGVTVIDTTNSSAWSTAQRAAGFTYFFVLADGSKGVHNRDYAKTLLLNAIASVHP